MFTNSDINFLAYRTDLSRPTPEKDLSTFIDQMQRVSVQVCNFLFLSLTAMHYILFAGCVCVFNCFADDE